MVVPHSWADPYALLTRPPLPTTRRWLLARLACVRPAASVRSEPGSNSHVTDACSFKQTDKHKSRPSILKHLQNTRNNFNAPNRHTNADRASLPTSNNSLCQRTAPMTAKPPKANGTPPSKDDRAVGGAYTPGLEWCQSVITGFFFMFSKKVRKGRKYRRLTCTGHINIKRSARRWRIKLCNSFKYVF